MLDMVIAIALMTQDRRVTGPSNDEVTAPPALEQKCAPSSDDELVVCARADAEEAFRLRPLPPTPKSEGLLTRPLRVEIAPGVSIGFQQGGGFGVKAKFGGAEKTKETK
jgi:hypothetical protein